MSLFLHSWIVYSITSTLILFLSHSVVYFVSCLFNIMSLINATPQVYSLTAQTNHHNFKYCMSVSKRISSTPSFHANFWSSMNFVFSNNSEKHQWCKIDIPNKKQFEKFYKLWVEPWAEGDVTRQGTVEKKYNWVVICSRQPSSTMVD